mmetsp:Transcript_19065/g.44541  ORF Transcript_19065/g.44541 Transcript_19065/m.44541 type:complete len:322 (-) Transcript_19065:334-1299(-)|eukprot:CAMPEP_0178451328 /NCGR_PEP_ID=MMETSP0689_2-20121128/43620_1 /TAXON_ID=160604 /ORGANISM="Amphidinium massartii, Strain CS-259" /LENGTH=321 /DNA_ID=CAMNT_0020076895 /DNA_START=57 /DNA_END=1022 /DNA_ORIENTATION=-
MAQMFCVRVAAVLTLLVAVSRGEQWTDPCDDADAASMSVDHTHAKLAMVLSAHTQRGEKAGITANLVDYAGLKQDPSTLREYLKTLCNVDLNALDDEHKLALLINTYNAAMMAMVVAYDIQSSVLDVSGIWNIQFVTVGGQKYSLDDVEHTLIRGASPPSSCNSQSLSGRLGASGRIHAAVNCASMSCPDLNSVPFLASTIQEQLTSATQSWLLDPTRNPGLVNGGLQLSRIFEWYGCDMEIEAGTKEEYVARFTNWTIPAGTGISHVAYNWELNAATNAVTGTGLEGNAAPHRYGAISLVTETLILAIVAASVLAHQKRD